MKLKEVILASNFENYFSCLDKYYRGAKDLNRDKIHKGYEQIRALEYTEVEEILEIIIGSCEEDGYMNFDVSGYSKKEDMPYSLMFDEWENWISYDVDSELIKTMTYSEITAHCIWEMSWHGWTVEDRKYNLELDEKETKINETLEELEKTFISNNETITDSYLDRLISEYKSAETDNLETGIEIIIENLINAKLVLSHHIETIQKSFDDEDIDEALKTHYQIN